MSVKLRHYTNKPGFTEDFFRVRDFPEDPRAGVYGSELAVGAGIYVLPPQPG